MALYLAHARSNEMGGTIGGQRGDQSGHEVEISAFVEYDWTDVFRPKKLGMPLKMAKAATAICQNNNIGYDHNDRYSMFDLAKARNWDFAGLDTPCSTDCSQMVSSIINSLGISCNRWMWTGSMVGDMEKTGAFDRLPYTGKEMLKTGDVILTLKHGHTATIVSLGDPQPVFTPFVGEAYGAELIPVWKDEKKTQLLPGWSYLGTGNLFDVMGESGDMWSIHIAKMYFGYIEKKFCLRKTPYGTGRVTTDLHMRQNAGTQFKSLAIMPKNTVVQLCDTKIASTGKPWYYIIHNGQYGFASSTYIKKT